MSDNNKIRRKTSIIWNYFTAIDNQDAFCNECQKRVSYRTTTTNLRKHLASKHPCINISTEGNNIHSEEITKDLGDVGVEYEIENNTPEVLEYEEEIAPQYIPNNKTRSLISKIKNRTQCPSSDQPKKIFKSNQSNNKSEMIQEAINILSSVSHVETAPENDDDEFTQFGKYLIAQLKQLPLVNALQLQEKFQSLLTRERINVMLKDSGNSIKSCVHCCQCYKSPRESSTLHKSTQISDKTIEMACISPNLTQEVQIEQEILTSSCSNYGMPSLK